MSGSAVLVLVMGVLIVGLLVLAAATFFPGLSLPTRRRPERAPKLVDLSDRLSPYAVTRPVIDLTEAERPLETAAPEKATRARKSTGARKTTARRTPAKAGTRTHD